MSPIAFPLVVLPTIAQLDWVDYTAAGKMEDDAEDLRHGEEAALVSDAAAARRPWCQGLGAWFAEKFVGLAEGLGRRLKQALRGRAGEVEELVAIPAGVGVTEQALRVCCLSTYSVGVLRTSHVAVFVHPVNLDAQSSFQRFIHNLFS